MKIKSLIPIFCEWLNENQARFLVKPEIASINAKQKKIKIIFPSIPDVLTAYFDCRKRYIDIHVAAERDGILWDWICDLDFRISKVENSYVCDFCEGEKMIYPTLAAFAIQHIFEDFLKWCNENMGNAQGLAFYGNPNAGESSWARLVPKNKKLSDFQPDYYFSFNTLSQ